MANHFPVDYAKVYYDEGYSDGHASDSRPVHKKATI